ncbi:MAG TPA: hypothetical protein VE641_03620 [Chthoniobacterales bacterium]|nr:hypothetical protein [Chthoniobacterales bacterium]
MTVVIGRDEIFLKFPEQPVYPEPVTHRVFKTGRGAIGFPDQEGHYFINVGGATAVSQP